MITDEDAKELLEAAKAPFGLSTPLRVEIRFMM